MDYHVTNYMKNYLIVGLKQLYITNHYIHFQCLKKKYNQKEFENTMEAFKECLSLPIFPTITKKQQDYVVFNLKKFQN